VRRATPPDPGAYRTIERALAYRTARIICVSSGERERGLAVADSERLVVVPNGVAGSSSHDRPVADSGERCATIVVGTVARLAEQKGVDILLAAMAHVHRERDDVRLVIAGDGPQRGRLEQLARQLGSDDRTRFLGAVASPWEVLSTLDLFVLPSRWEGLPYTLLEAMAAGLPCVATAVDGVADVIGDRRLGTIVPIGDHERMAREILAFIEDAPARRSTGEHARDHVRSAFSVRTMVERTVDVYRDVVACDDPPRTRVRVGSRVVG
jgi:glycosyltransferase involved in cell wall biosynthesis